MKARQPLAVRLFAPVDIASLVYFRIAFGALMLIEVWRYFHYGWIARYYIDPIFYFKYYGFGWVHPWPGDWMYVHFLALGVLAVCVMLGLWYRTAMALLFLGFTYVFLLDQTNYLNHFYLISLFTLIMTFAPAHRAFSVDAARHPEIRADTAPAWALWLLRAQMGIAYFYAGVAKLNGDWLRGEPMRIWLANRTHFPIIGRLFTQEWMVYFFSYGGLLLDLCIVPLLLWRRTRPFAFAAALVFHLTNAELFQIGIFPWFALAATLLFFEPDWPRFRWLRAKLLRTRWASTPQVSGGALDTAGAVRSLRASERFVLAAMAIYLGIQLLLPLRHFIYPGNVSWTEEGHRFSWHMMLRTKNAKAGFFATDPATGQTWEIDPAEHLTRRQAREMKTRPDMILQFAHYVARLKRAEGYPHIQVRARIMASLNGRRPQLLVDPNVDLASVRRSVLPASWIISLTEPLRRDD